MDFAASVRTQVERDERALAALYAQQAEALTRRRVADEELVRATATARAAAMDLETLNCLIGGRLELIARQNVTRSPIQRLPQNVLVLVFLAHPSPLIVASVCRAWRSTALEAPELWTSIILDVEENVQREIEYLEAISPRSQRLSLSIRISAPPIIDADAMGMLGIALPNVIARAHTLALWYIPGDRRVPDLDHSILKFLQLPTPRLRHLEIAIPDFFFNCDCAEMLPYTPVLESITMDLPLCIGDLKRADLRALRKIRSPPPRNAEHFARFSIIAPNLKSIVIHGIFSHEVSKQLVLYPFASLESLALSSLLDLSRFPPDSFPAVTALNLYIDYYTDPFPLPQLPHLRLLRSLQLSPRVLVHTRLDIPLFQQFPQVETLILSGLHESAKLWADMTKPQNIVVLPRLRTLVLEYHSFESDDGITLIKFLEARAALGQDGENSLVLLEKLSIRCSAFPHWAVAQLEACVGTVVTEDQEVPDYFCD